MVKRLFLILVFLFTLIFPKSIQAQSEFFIDSDVTYSVSAKGLTTVTHNVTLENVFKDLYATTYTLSLQGINPMNASVFENDKKLNLETIKEGNTTNLKITFDEPTLGKGAQKRFRVTYENNQLATKTGDVWEVAIPGLTSLDSYRNYHVTLFTPLAFGSNAYISPNPYETSQNASSNIYKFKKDQITDVGISAGFGKYQVFSFSLTYHLENPLGKAARTEIAIPPDTSYQKMFYEDITPKPSNITTDKDGNWLAEYILDAHERVDVKAVGAVQLFSTPRFLTQTSQNAVMNLGETKYWQTSDPIISNLAKTLDTPKKIYNYVVSNLAYDYDRIKPNIERKGASLALATPLNSICMEFTDAFIAIARAAGIPAREINGFAYTENPEIEPLSLVADVLHAWPEYWDKQKNVWVPIDPTWASTTGGVNFFDKLDLRHFTFVIHGIDSEHPFPPGSYKLGANPQKDVFVSFGELPIQKTPSLELVAPEISKIPFVDKKIIVKVNNNGPTAIYNLGVDIYFDSKLVDTKQLASLLPLASGEITIDLFSGLIAKDYPSIIKVVTKDTFVEIPTNKTEVLVYNLLFFFAALSILIISILVGLRKIKLANLIQTFKNAKFINFRKKIKKEQDPKEQETPEQTP